MTGMCCTDGITTVGINIMLILPKQMVNREKAVLALRKQLRQQIKKGADLRKGTFCRLFQNVQYVQMLRQKLLFL